MQVVTDKYAYPAALKWIFTLFLPITQFIQLNVHDTFAYKSHKDNLNVMLLCANAIYKIKVTALTIIKYL